MNWTSKDLKHHLAKKSKPTSLFPQDDVWTNPHMDDYNMLVEQLKDNMAIYIPGNVPSLKNSKQIFQMNTGKSHCCNAPYTKIAVKQYKCTKCNVVSGMLGKRATLVPSETHKKYKEATTSYYIKEAKKFSEMVMNMHLPLYIGLYYIRSTERNFDFDNATSTVMDLITANQWIADDSANIILPVPLGYHVDKKHQGVIIVVTDKKPTYHYENSNNNSRNSSAFNSL